MTQTSHDFPFGSAVKHSEISGTAADNVKYQDCYYENFNWAVLENALKWKQMERNQVSACVRAMTSSLIELY